MVRSGTHRGLVAVRQFFEDLLEPFEDVVVKADRFFESGDQIVVFVLLRSRPSGSSAVMEIQIGHLWTMRDGKAAQLEIFPEREKALDAVGLSEQDGSVTRFKTWLGFERSPLSCHRLYSAHSSVRQASTTFCIASIDWACWLRSRRLGHRPWTCYLPTRASSRRSKSRPEPTGTLFVALVVWFLSRSVRTTLSARRRVQTTPQPRFQSCRRSCPP